MSYLIDRGAIKMKHQVRPFAQKFVSLLEDDDDTFRILHEALDKLKKEIKNYRNDNTFSQTLEKIDNISETIRLLSVAIYQANLGQI